MQVRTSKSWAIVLCQKSVDFLFPVESGLLPHGEKSAATVSQELGHTSEDKMKQWDCATRALPGHCGQEGLWECAWGSGRKKENANTRGRTEFLFREVVELTLRVQSPLLHIEKNGPVEVVGESDRDSSKVPSHWRVFSDLQAARDQ